MHTKSSIRNILRNDWRAVRRGIIVLYTRGQSPDEQATKTARYRNRRGFSAATAKRGSIIARKFINGWGVSTRDWGDALQITLTHAGQLARIANAKERREAYQPAYRLAA